MNAQLDCLWNYGWIDWDGLNADDLESIVTEYKESEEKNLKEIVDDSIKVLHAIVVGTFDITEGKYHCGSCDCYFEELDDGCCLFCGSANVSRSAVIEPDTEPKTEDKQCYNHCPKCNATDPDIEWHEKDWSGDAAWQNATCLKCGHEFSEVYVYSFTEPKHNR
jgi:hypothetical protein